MGVIEVGGAVAGPRGDLAPLRAEFFVGLMTAFAEGRADCEEFALGALVEGFGAHPRQHVKRAAQSSGAGRVRAGSTRLNGVSAMGLFSTPCRKDMICCVKDWWLLSIAAGAELLCEPRRKVISQFEGQRVRRGPDLL
jgi:hypothetical protein